VGANLTRQVFGQGPLDATVPEVFAELVAEYATELDRAIGQGTVDDATAQDLARRLGYLRASARDAVKLHRTALERVVGAASPEQLRAGLDIGRLLLISVLLHLATYFRGGFAGDRPEPVAVAVRR
jgi:hypothetical protein